jgi:hypothetical protein
MSSIYSTQRNKQSYIYSDEHGTRTIPLIILHQKFNSIIHIIQIVTNEQYCIMPRGNKDIGYNSEFAHSFVYKISQ